MQNNSNSMQQHKTCVIIKHISGRFLTNTYNKTSPNSTKTILYHIISQHFKIIAHICITMNKPKLNNIYLMPCFNMLIHNQHINSKNYLPSSIFKNNMQNRIKKIQIKPRHISKLVFF